MKDEVHFEGKIALKALIVNGKGEVLLMRDPREDKEIWEIPGGRMNEDEEPRAALAREIHEELGVVVEVGEVMHMEQFIQGSEGARAFVIVFRATLDSDDFVLETSEVAEIGWFGREAALALTLFPEYRQALEKYFG